MKITGTDERGRVMITRECDFCLLVVTLNTHVLVIIRTGGGVYCFVVCVVY